jgi:RNase adapter protein RapZ
MTQTNSLKNIRVLSFGFKHAPPPFANIVEDVRWVRNPFYEPGLHAMTGADRPVQEFILAQPDVLEFLSDMRNNLRRRLRGFRHSNYHETLTIAFGCTGGKHRSRFFAIKCAEMLAELSDEFGITPEIVVEHRDQE